MKAVKETVEVNLPELEALLERKREVLGEEVGSPACSRTLRVFSVLGFISSARNWLRVVSLSPIRSVR